MSLKLDRSSLDSGIEVITLSGSLTLGRDSQGVEWTVEELLKNRQNRIVIDLQGVSFVDSAGIGILVGCHGKAVSAGGQLRIAGVAERVSRVLQITKVDSVLHIDPTLADSVKFLSAT